MNEVNLVVRKGKQILFQSTVRRKYEAFVDKLAYPWHLIFEAI